MKYGKTAFVVGVMFTVGKYVGETFIEVAERAIVVGLKRGSENGNDFAKTMCEKMGINNSKSTERVVMGFKAE